MALIFHYTRNENGRFDVAQHYGDPMTFVAEHIPDGVPFVVYRDQIGEDNNVTEDFDALRQPGNFYVVEGAGGGVVSGVLGFVGKILNPILKLLSPSQKTSSVSLDNAQAESPNNSLTDRNNKPRPYQRTYDICGTVQSIPCDLMTVYQVYNSAGKVIEFGYYEVGRGPLLTPASGVTDGDTLLSDLTGSSAAVYGPFTSPNSGAPQLQIGDPITEGLYITVSSNEIDGAVLKAPNDLNANIGEGTTASLSGTVGTILDPSGDAEFDAFLKAGDTARLANVSLNDPSGPDPYLDGAYTVLSVSSVDLVLDVSNNLSAWQVISPTVYQVHIEDPAGNPAKIGPTDTIERSYSDWATVDRIESERLLVNVSADNGMYKDKGGSSKKSASVTAEVQYQLIDGNGTPYGPMYTAQGTITGRSADATGVTIVADLPTPSAFRCRCRRVTELDLDFEGQVVDEVKYSNLYGQSRDRTPDYGDRTTVHTARRQTPRATAVKQPQLKMLVTEMCYKYLGNGVFDSQLTPNTQAIQSLIRLLRDPVINSGALTLTTDNLDKLLATQVEIEEYFQDARAGQFCYTFDSLTTTAQDIITTIAEAVFCSASRKGHSVLLTLERPRPGPEMVFTHRSKAPTGEKWTRQFNDKSAYDSLEFSYIDPDTNVKATIKIPETGGLKTDTYDSKGIRNYPQAYWHAWRRYQRNLLNRVAVEFTAMEEGILAVPGRPISVVKGSRVSPYDGYVIAVDGLTLTLSQNVEFTPGADHSVILKRRDGSVQSVAVAEGPSNRKVVMLSAPAESVYTGNNELKTEFSFGSDSRHSAQMMLVSTVDPNDDRTVKITGFNYHPDYYIKDGVPPFGRAFSNGFNTGFS